ncbi:MAG: TetR/AcrR family transcriptional regulator [Actinomycetales bacterium]|nr:TetR/AcrR family transcriptional regulator [Actinomycetales bacterium]
MAAPRTARERARAELTRDIKDVALRQIAGSGAAGLSLRGISRELGMVSSAIYRYFPSRDDLLTAMLIDFYSELADALWAAQDTIAAEATRTSAGFRRRWVTVCTAMRDWALAHPHQFTLLYGTPVPGYRAPVDTTVPAERVMTAFSGIVDEAARAGLFTSVRALPDGESGLVGQLTAAGSLLGEQIPPEVLARTVAGLAQVIGMITLELGGHFVGGFEPADALFEHAATRLAETIER